MFYNVSRLVCALMVFYLSACSLCYGQSEVVSITEINSGRELSDRTVTRIISDHAGLLWIATRNGINRYDGRNILAFDNRTRTKYQISARDIKDVCVRTDGSLVLQYDLNRRFLDLLPATSTVATKLFLKEENGVEGEVQAIYLEHRSGDVYLLTKLGISLAIQRLNDQDYFETLLKIADHPAKTYSLYQFVALRDKGFLINDSGSGVVRVDPAGKVMMLQSLDTLGLDATQGEATILHQDKQGRQWLAFGSVPGVWEYNEAAELFKPFFGQEENQFFADLWEDKLGNVMLQQTQEEQSQLYFVGNDDEVKEYSSLIEEGYEINAMYSDDFERLIFLGTNEGVRKVMLTKKWVNNISHRDSLGQEKPMKVHGIVALPTGNIIVTDAFGSWYELEAGLDTPRRLLMDSSAFLPDDCACASPLIFDGTHVWGARFSEGSLGELISYEVATGRFKYYDGFPQRIVDLTASVDGNLWLVTGSTPEESRLTTFDVRGSNFYHYTTDDGSNPIEGKIGKCILEAKSGILWIGTDDGLVYIDRTDHSAESKNYTDNDYYGISNDNVLAISEIEDGQLLIGTQGGGLNQYDPVRETFTYHDRRDGLPNNSINGIQQDLAGNIWLSTYRGMSLYNRSLKLFRNFGKLDGFEHNQFSPLAHACDSNGVLYFGTAGGVDVFRAEDLLETDIDAPVLLSELSYFDRSTESVVILEHNLQNLKEIKLPADYRYLHCTFTLADLAFPEESQYRYKVEGLDEDWTYLSKVNELRFNDLAAGNYRLVVEGIDRNGNISGKAMFLDIEVDSFFFQKAWFIAICLGFISIFVYLIHQFRLQQAIRLERLRTKISSDLHDDVGGLLSGLAMQTELLEYSANEKDRIKLQRISEMSRNAMAQMRDVIWATDARKDRFEDLLERMKEYAAEILFPRAIDFYFTVTNINREKKIPVHIRQNIYLIVKEALTNIAKHSNAKRVDINISKEGNVFILDVCNDGTTKKVVNGAISRKGSGLKNMEMRAQNMNAEIAIEKNDGYNVSLTMRAFV